MLRKYPNLSAALLGLAVITLLPISLTIQAQSAAVDTQAIQVLRGMTEYLGGLKQFSVHTQNTYEDELEEGQRVDYDVSADMVLSRPDKLHSKRSGELLSQEFFYDGKTLALYNQSAEVYATRPAPGTIEETIDYTREELGLIVPASDLIYSQAFSLLTQDLISAVVVGKTEINGVACQHLAFSKADVSFQLWVQEGAAPLPCKYVVTDTELPGMYSVSTIMSEWNVAPQVSGDMFTFSPPENAGKIDFLPLDSASGH